MIKLTNVLTALLLSSVLIVVSCLGVAAGEPISASAGDLCRASFPCGQCHQVTIDGVHSHLQCRDCHGSVVAGDGASKAKFDNPADMLNGASGCASCHKGTEHIFHQAMTTRAAEQQFCQRSWGRADPDFYSQNCVGCHVSSCLDCHSANIDNGGNVSDGKFAVQHGGHAIQRPDSTVCYRCHNGYFIGWDYAGRAPREDSLRYQRGPQANGQYFLKMLPDIHYEAGLECSDCHTMASLQRGDKAAKRCRDCHTPDPEVIEHSIDAHLNRMECASCHAAWAAQDYGSYYIRTINSSNRQYFRVRELNDKYVKSSYLKRQDLPQLGLNDQGLIAPIRPQFIAYYCEMNNNVPVGEENRQLAAQWKAFAPHTIRRGAPMCDSCHGNARRFMLQPLDQRVYRPDLDGLHLECFWRSQGQTLVNGSFYSQQQFDSMSQKTSEYARKYVEKWQSFLKKDVDSCVH
ncbi:MAG: cytochrome C [Desulfobacteraceae bacterium 4572_35.1]|nr:MAG: cytochrome C [Desulfobacteraceae bacterium 4572_35.1]